ncbi:MAG: polysaccharide pyruvyl transferase family protein [Selenomonadaceae bacterium]|nr:polysaccharide pyruvyl transferase family protein [Selenomonadaceae bacterium]
MKVAQITLNGYFNYGNILQKYALYQTLKKFVDDVTVLWYGPNNFTPEVGGNFSLIPQHVLRNNPFDYQRCSYYESARLTKFKEFAERNIKTRFHLPYLEEIADDYDFFVVGSDQVWNPNDPSIPYPARFLEFVPREKKLAYAASIATPKIPDAFKEYFRQGILSFDYVSVREEGAVKIVEELTGKTPLLLLDPVLLLSADEWKKIARPPSWFNEKYQRGYIFTYYLRNDPPLEINSVAAELNLPVINALNFNNFNHSTIGIEEFLFLIMNASLVYANSFHGIAFSILFKRPFINREYDDESTRSMSLRIPGLLKMFGLENRIATADNGYKIDSPLEIDFSVRDKILPLERLKAFKFLADALYNAADRAGGVVN